MTELHLQPLRQVTGVMGSFACGTLGQLLLNDMPPQYASPTLESAAACLLNLFQTADEAMSGCRSVKVAFGEHQILARRFRFGVLGILTTRAADARTLLVMTRLIAMRLGRDPRTSQIF